MGLRLQSCVRGHARGHAWAWACVHSAKLCLVWVGIL